MEIQESDRGFKYAEFVDTKGVTGFIQESSVVENYKAIWIGCRNIDLKEFVANRKPSAWMDVTLPKTMEHHYSANTALHLSQDQVRQLLPALIHFAETGQLPSSNDVDTSRPKFKIGDRFSKRDGNSPLAQVILTIVKFNYRGYEESPWTYTFDNGEEISEFALLSGANWSEPLS